MTACLLPPTVQENVLNTVIEPEEAFERIKFHNIDSTTAKSTDLNCK